jgi:hypothetical protein
LKSTNFAWKKYVKEFNYLFENRNRIQFWMSFMGHV